MGTLPLDFAGLFERVPVDGRFLRLRKHLLTVRRTSHTIDWKRSISKAPFDDRIIEAAVAGKCQAIVTGDKDLLRLRNFRGITILTAQELLQQERAK
jgi:predicted nucleic acid-binding protein